VVVLKDKTDVPAASKLKPISVLLDSSSLISQELLQLILWVSHYYHYPLRGDCKIRENTGIIR
jgi:primosomal protein N'